MLIAASAVCVSIWTRPAADASSSAISTLWRRTTSTGFGGASFSGPRASTTWTPGLRSPSHGAGPMSVPSTKTSTFASAGALTTRCPVVTSAWSGPATVASSPPLSFTSLRMDSKPGLRHDDDVRPDVGAQRTGERGRARVVLVERHGGARARSTAMRMVPESVASSSMACWTDRRSAALIVAPYLASRSWYASYAEAKSFRSRWHCAMLRWRLARGAMALALQERGEGLAVGALVVELQPRGEELLRGREVGRARARGRRRPRHRRAASAEGVTVRTKTIAIAATSQRARIDGPG